MRLGKWVDPRQLDEQVLREAWRHRSRFMDLKPTVDPEADYQKFAALVLGCHFGWLLRDEAGTLQGTAFSGMLSLECQGRPFVWWVVEYMFISQEFRPSTGLALWAAAALAELFRRAKGRPIFCGGAGYPPSVLYLCRVAEPVWMGLDEGIPAWEKAARQVVVDATTGWDQETGRVNMRTVPREPWLRPPSEPRLRAYWDRYHQASPDWHQGITPFCFARIDPRQVLRRAGPFLHTRLRSPHRGEASRA